MFRHRAGFDHIITERPEVRGLPFLLKPRHEVNTFFRDEKNNKKEQKAGHECGNPVVVSMRATRFMIMHDVMTKRKSNAVCRHVTL